MTASRVEGAVRLNRRQVVLGLIGLSILETGCRGAVPATQAALTPEQFGARGDGATDDTGAFERLNRAVAAAGGGVVELRPGAVYRVGRQRPSPERFLSAAPILHARGVDHFVVRMNGATLKYNDGLQFGAFDRRTGAKLRTAMPFLDRRAVAELGHAILAENVGRFEVSNGTLDLNSAAMEIGGQYGDTGWQVPHYGVAGIECGTVAWTDVHVRNSCLDGFLYHYSGPRRSEEFPLVMQDCSAERVGRNCVSVTGCKGAWIQGCRFERAGEAPGPNGSSIGSAPKSCFDVEAEGAVCRHVVIENCAFRAGEGSNTAFVADSGDTSDILIQNSILQGNVWSSKPRTTIRNCEVLGGFGKLLAGQPDPRDNALIAGCRISDRRWPGAKAPVHAAISSEGAGANARSPLRVQDCTFDLYFHAVNLRWSRLERVTFNVHAGRDTLPSGQYVMFLGGATVRGMRIVDRISPSKAPALPYYVHEASAAKVEDGEIVSPRGRILWNASSPQQGGYGGRFRDA